MHQKHSVCFLPRDPILRERIIRNQLRGFGDCAGNVILFLDLVSEPSFSAKRDFVLNTTEIDWLPACCLFRDFCTYWLRDHTEHKLMRCSIIYNYNAMKIHEDRNISSKVQRNQIIREVRDTQGIDAHKQGNCTDSWRWLQH